jgi:predicted ATPase/DNA-binding XRE family transcriptional regulator
MESQGEQRSPSFGQLLRHYREAAGLTQEALADRAELSVRGVRYLERDLRRPYRDTVRRLADALALPAREFAVLSAAARPPQASSAPQPGVATRAELPLPAGPLIGREREVAAVAQLLHQEDVRVLTLTGPGGVGKTRLALEVARRLHSAFPEGVAWIPLAALTDAGLVPAAIARALQLRETGGHSLQEALTLALRERHGLLLLDNFEHLAAAAPLVADLVAASPHLKVFVTSRAALDLRSEHVFPVPPLRPPDAASEASVYALAANPAVDLFLRRAQAVTPDFALTAANAVTVAAICRRLEGLPLALELAAARIRVLPPEAMLPRLEHRLTFLTGRAPDAPARQRTMRETIAWSYDLLTPREQLLFRRLAVFVGGSLPAIEAVCTAAGDPPVDVLDDLEALLRSSLLQREETAGQEPRFAMLETVREYALERLAETREAAPLAQQHAAYYLAWAEMGAPQVFSAAQGRWLDRLEQEHDNLRAALRWCIEQRNAALGLRLTAALWLFWYVRGYAEGRAHLAALLTLPEAAVVLAPRAASLLGAGQLALTQGEYAVARAFLAESIALFRALGDARGAAEALLGAGFVARVQEEYEAAHAVLEEALALARAVGHRFITAASLHHLGMMAVDERQDYGAARSLLEDSLALYRALDLPRFVGLVSLSLGEVARAGGDEGRALRLFREGLTKLIEVGEQLELAAALDSFAHLAMDGGRARRAVWLSGAAARLREAAGTSVWPTVQRSRERWLTAARETLGDADFRAAWAQGQTMTRERAIAYALDEADVPRPAMSTDPGARPRE